MLIAFGLAAAVLAILGILSWIGIVWPAAIATGKDVAATVQSVFTIGAIIAAAWWFMANRQDKPRIKIEHIVSHRQDAGEPGNIFVGIEVKVTNIGNVNVDLGNGEIEIAEVNPNGTSLEKKR